MRATCQFHSPATSPSEIHPNGPYCMKDWAGPNADLDIATDRQFSAPARNCIPSLLVRTSLYRLSNLARVTVQCHFRPKYLREHSGHHQAHVKMRNCCFSTSYVVALYIQLDVHTLKTGSPCSVLSARRHALFLLCYTTIASILSFHYFLIYTYASCKLLFLIFYLFIIIIIIIIIIIL